MDRSQISVGRATLGSAVRSRRKSRSQRQSMRSVFGVASRLGLTPALTTQRLNTSRKPYKSQTITEKINPEHLALLVKRQWKLSYVTPLYQFRHTQMTTYARRLSAFIAAEKQKGLAVEVGELQDTFKVCFSVLQGMSEAKDDPEAILIQVKSRPMFAKQDEPQKTVWSGWLACVDGNPEYLNSLPTDFTCLPLFGSNGAEGLSSLVKSWFQINFDCCFGPLDIGETSLEWLAALWTNCNGKSNIQSLKMHWTIPAVHALHVEYTVSADDAWALWCSIRGRSLEESNGTEEEGCIDIEEVKSFMQGLMGHFYRHFRLDLSTGNLNQISTALGSATLNDRIKVSTSIYLISTLRLLTELALLRLPI
ncbi:PREDICTED: centromere protein L [Cyprinodon variegatus]|uniref:Centromere protein L n=1 Tax=Cyprinodon variegatus TaxID=28743 RepID=A0A3Q2EHF6_CYPVA|nr:PREDICTED: centromere protein L [Cyprinodon variegatus]